MRKFLVALFLGVLFVGSWADVEDEVQGPFLTQEQMEIIMESQPPQQVEHFIKELELFDYLSNHEDDGGFEDDSEEDSARTLKDKKAAAGKVIKDVGMKLKKNCDCPSHKVCGCCVKKSFTIPKTKIQLKPKFCGNVTIFPEQKSVGFNLIFSKMSLFKKKISLKDIKGKQCIKMPSMENIEICFKMEVTESKQKGLTACIKGEANLMMFVQKFRFPCFSFKNGKLTAEETGKEDDEEEGVSLNFKGAYNGVKNFFGFGKKTTPATSNDDF